MHLLAVDDEPAILELLELLVQFSGDHTITTASCVVDALDIVAQPGTAPIDCFLIDIQMPGTDGIELCRILRDRPEHRETPILMLTAMSEKTYVDRAFAAGASDYVIKPFDIDDLRDKIQSVESHIRGTGDDAMQADADAEGPRALHEPFQIRDLDGVIDYMALENYVAVMSRRKLFGSSVIGITIRDIENLYRQSTQFEYECTVTDVAEAITLCLGDAQYLVAYAGNGTFLCVVEDGWQPKRELLTDQVNLALRRMGLFFNDGREMHVAVSAGDVIRLVWKTGTSAAEALAAAHESAEKESLRHTRQMDDFWSDNLRVSG